MSHPKTTFVHLMALERVGSPGRADTESIFMSKVPAWMPAAISTYGGHVYAQAAWAASQTVNEGFVVHNIHGYFTLPGLNDRPFVYEVSRVSEGRSYCTRSVTVRQPVSPSAVSEECSVADASFELSDGQKELGKVCFTCICSFRRDSGDMMQPSHQENKNIENEYSSALKGTRPRDHEVAPNADAPWYYSIITKHPQPCTFPGLDIRKVDMSSYNTSKPPISYRQLSYYRSIGSIPASSPNLHACAHLYASDRNSLFLITNALDIKDIVPKMGSLSHSVIFHVDSRNLMLLGEDHRNKEEETWFCQEAWTPRSRGGVGMHESKIWNAEGLHIASTWQEGIIKRQISEGEEALQKLQKVIKQKTDKSRL